MNELAPIVAGRRSCRSQSFWIDCAPLNATVLAAPSSTSSTTRTTPSLRRRRDRRAFLRWRRWLGTYGRELRGRPLPGGVLTAGSDPAGGGRSGGADHSARLRARRRWAPTSEP